MTEVPVVLSIVSPVYKGEKMVDELVHRIVQSIETITSNYEIILVNDASPDNSWGEIIKQCHKDTRVKGLNLSRNFGQHYAITAGLQYSQGEWVVVMDCDLQDRPEEIPNLYSKALEGYESVFAQRINRADNWIKRTSSKYFYRLFSYLTETRQDESVANFGIYNRIVINSVLKMGDHIRYFPTQVQWVGYKKYYFPVTHDSRFEGKSSYNYKKLFHLAFDTIISFSDKPIRLTMKIGGVITIVSFIIGLIYLILYFTGNIKVMGYTSIIISLWLICGILVSLIGILGLYIGKTFEQTKDRPSFIVAEEINIHP